MLLYVVLPAHEKFDARCTKNLMFYPMNPSK